MTVTRSFFEVQSPFELDVLVGSESEIGNAILRWSMAGLTVRMVRGSKMPIVSELFDEFSAALQFPLYFGENWDAFDECLSDLDWLPVERGRVIVVTAPEHVLTMTEPRAMQVLVRCIEVAAAEFSKPIVDAGENIDRAAIPFRVVLATRPESVPAVAARWAGVPMRMLG
ncbi:barstar family protein [Cryobacterium tepidiphilum]|uniref:Barstar (barnase inhibitor) domain-containing protein n=1 Tax=Cryobacterium tepidiphilum TaxID=2486026 RepID=A0A3M8LR71_9MICO|nr:barstar family protein [Cryobacterium tepidiphilum]RNE67379.1 hypothetical protein EEJ31_00990 [Cryobacterium tepidiphilum]